MTDKTMLYKAGVWQQTIYGFLVIVAFFATIGALLFTPRANISDGIREVLLVLVGVLAGAFKDVIHFVFGSTLGSQKKDETP